MNGILFDRRNIAVFFGHVNNHQKPAWRNSYEMASDAMLFQAECLASRLVW